MSHLYEELAKRKALVEQVNKLQSEVDQLDTTKAVTEKVTSSTLPSGRAQSTINIKSTAQTTKAVTTPSSSSLGSVMSHAKPLASVTSGLSSSPAVISKPSVVMSSPSGAFGSSLLYSTTQPQLVNSYRPLLRPVVGVPVQMVSYIDKDGKLFTPAQKSKQAKQTGNARKKAKLSQQSKPAISVTLPSSPAVLNPQAVSTVASPSTPTGSVWQSPSVSRPYQPLVTSPVTPVSASSRPGSQLTPALSFMTSPVTPTPVRQVPGNLSSAVPLSAVPSSTQQRSSAEVPPMVSFVQSGLSFISPLSPLSSMSVISRAPTSGVTPLSSLSASTEKYLNTFTTQTTAASRPSFSSSSQSLPVSSSQLSYSSRSPFLNTDLSTDHSAGIKLLCDLLNDTLPEQPPPLVATSLAVRSLGTPTSLAPASSIPDSSRVEQRHVDTPPKTTSNSPRTPPVVTASQSHGAISSSVEQTTSAQRTLTTAGTPPVSKKRTSPFAIENLVRSNPESQSGKSPSETELGKRHPSPASSTNRSSPKGKNKSPSTNFSIAHITRDMNAVTSKGHTPSLVTTPAVYSDEKIQHRRTSPPLPRISNPETDGSRIKSSVVISSNAVQSSMEPASRSVSSAGAVDVQRQRVCAPVARVCSPPSEKNCLVQSRLVSNEVSRSSVAQGTSPAQAGDAGRPISNLQESAGPKSGNPQLSCPLAGSSSSKEDLQFSSEVTSSNLSVNKISSSVSPERRQDASSSQELIAANIPEIPLDMIPLPSDKRPSPTSLSGKTSSAVKKRSSPVLQIPKSTSPDSEVSSLMAHETLPQSPSISSSVSKAGTVVLEGQAPALVDSNPCSARSPIPVAPSSLLQPNSGVSLPSFGSVFSPTKGGEPVSSEDSTAKNR